MFDLTKEKYFLTTAGKVSGWLLLSVAAILIISGITGGLSWLTLFGYEYLETTHAAYPRHSTFIRPLLVLVGLLLVLLVFGRRYLFALWDGRRPNTGLLISVFLLVMFFIMGFVAYIPFQNYPFSMDEYNYLYQAQIFSLGKLYLEFPEEFSNFVEQYVIFTEGKLFSKYAPGFSAILSLGVLLDMSGWVNPAIAIATLVVLFFFARSFFGTVYAFFAVVLMATTPYFIAYSASYFSQPIALFLTSLTFLLVRQYELTSKNIYLPAIGLVAGYAALTRPLDCFCLIVPAYLYLMYLLYQKRDLKKISYPIITFTILFVFFLLYNFNLTGIVSIATYPIATGEFKVVDPNATGFFGNLASIILDYIGNGIDSIPPLLIDHFLIPTALFIPIAALFGLFVFKDKWRWVLLANFAMLVLLSNFHPGTGWPQYGARYYYSGYFAVIIFATAALRWLFMRLKQQDLKFHLIVLLLITHSAFSIVAIWDYSYRFNVVSLVSHDIETQCDNNSLVLLNKRAVGRRNSELLRQVNYVDLSDFKRNPFMDESRLVTKYSGSAELRELMSYFPEHSVCLYSYDVLVNK